MTREQLEAIRTKRAEIDVARERVKAAVETRTRQVEQEHLVELHRQLLELEEATEPQPPPAVPGIASVPPAEAGKRAAAIRARKEYWNPSGTFDKDGNPVLTREAHEQLRRELVELDARAAEPGGA